MNNPQSSQTIPSGFVVETRTPLEVTDDEGISRVPNVVLENGLLLAPDMIPQKLLDLAAQVYEFVLTALWWDQSGRPEGDSVKAGTPIWDVMERLVLAAKAGGVAEGSRLFSTLPPRGHWFTYDPDKLSAGTGFDREELTHVEAAGAVLDEPRPVVG